MSQRLDQGLILAAAGVCRALFPVLPGALHPTAHGAHQEAGRSLSQFPPDLEVPQGAGTQILSAPQALRLSAHRPAAQTEDVARSPQTFFKMKNIPRT